jgi:curved DNA-binding protein CbpA
MLTHYDVLNVDPTAEFETIQRAWRVKVRLLHPDRHRDSPSDVQAEAAKETLRINNAWDTLRDPQKRREYDVYLMARHGLRRRTRDADSNADDPAADERDARSEWLSPQSYLTIVSILIVVVASVLVVAGAVLLAHLAQ